MRRWVLLAALSVVGCDDRPPPAGSIDAGPIPAGELRWGSCGDRFASCASVELPLVWSEPDGETFPVVVRRVGGLSPERHLWVLDGGPGGDVDGWESWAQRMTRRDPALTVYLLHQRGTGRSGRLDCVAAHAISSPGGSVMLDEEWPGCLAELRDRLGDTPDAIAPTASARDLAYLIDRVRDARDAPVFVMGTSYGTYLAQRYLQLAPDQADGVIMSGIVPPDLAHPHRPASFEAVSREVLAACGADAFCAERLGPDPAATFEDLLTRLDAGHCAFEGEPWDRDFVQSFFGSMLYDWELRPVGLAFLHRLDRCSDQDRGALTHLFSAFEGDAETGGLSYVFFRHVVLSELWTDDGPTLEEARALRDEALLGDVGLTALIEIRDAWPTYVPDAFDDRFADSSVPMLMMNGSLDPATPLAGARRVGDHFGGPRQTFVVIEGGAHGFGAPLEDGSSCAETMIDAFVRDPGAPVDDCGARVQPVSFEGLPVLASTLFGTGHLWDEASPDAITFVPPPDPALAERVRELLRRGPASGP